VLPLPPHSCMRLPCRSEIFPVLVLTLLAVAVPADAAVFSGTSAHHGAKLVGTFACDNAGTAGVRPACEFEWSLGATAPGASLAFFDDHMSSYPHVSRDADCDCDCALMTAAQRPSWSGTAPVPLVRMPVGTTLGSAGITEFERPRMWYAVLLSCSANSTPSVAYSITMRQADGAQASTLRVCYKSLTVM
jgi:hypothetical protein